MLGMVKKLLLIFVMLLVSISVADAEPTYDREGDMVVPDSRLTSGTVYSISPLSRDGSGYMIIDDAKYLVNDQTVFRNINGHMTGFANFMEGMRVEFRALENMMITKIMEIPALADDEDEEVDVSPDQDSDVEGLRLEDGVWVN